MTSALYSGCEWRLKTYKATVRKDWKNGKPGYVIVEHLAKLSSAGTWNIKMYLKIQNI